VKTFPEGPINVLLDGSHLQLTAGKRKHRIPTVDPAEFPALAPPPADGLTLPGASLATALEQAKPAASEDADRATLHGVFLEKLRAPGRN
jgi:DNA polymerase III sliding clamp (beta) subunit (PCNA family)